MNKEKDFSALLLHWNKGFNTREMPWKNETDPYKIWISEIILQQTRVAQGTAYYNSFIQAFPDVHSLAAAPENKVFKLWEGLGYYSRCKNLIRSAKFIAEELDGKFPDTYDDLLKLSGVGPYTAAAIASFAFDLPYAVLDGNVFRVLSRFFGLEIPIDSKEGKKFYATKAKDLLAKNEPAVYNQAIMDFGAVVCKPALPLCNECPLQRDCMAYHTNMVSQLPVVEKKITRRKRFFHFLIVEYNGAYYVRKRLEKDIWQNLFEFLLIESDRLLDQKELTKNTVFKDWFHRQDFEIFNQSPDFRQILTHQVISGRFFFLRTSRPLPTGFGYELITPESLHLLAFPKFITSFLKDKNVSLNLYDPVT